LIPATQYAVDRVLLESLVMNRKHHRANLSMRYRLRLESKKYIAGDKPPVRPGQWLWLGVVLAWAYTTALIYYVRLGWTWFSGVF
jgi:hypothetical protein